MKKECGFTLSELMIVVAVLSAIAIPIYSDNVRKTEVQEAVDTTGAMKDGINTYLQGGMDWVPPSRRPGQSSDRPVAVAI